MFRHDLSIIGTPLVGKTTNFEIWESRFQPQGFTIIGKDTASLIGFWPKIVIVPTRGKQSHTLPKWAFNFKYFFSL